jgi:hypothetical protein
MRDLTYAELDAQLAEQLPARELMGRSYSRCGCDGSDNYEGNGNGNYNGNHSAGFIVGSGNGNLNGNDVLILGHGGNNMEL